MPNHRIMNRTEFGELFLGKTVLLPQMPDALTKLLKELLFHFQSLVSLEWIALQTYTSGADMS